MFHVKHNDKRIAMFHVKHNDQKTTMFHVKHNDKMEYINLLANITVMRYHINDTTFMFESGQNWKVAALKTTNCVCLFLYKEV